MSIYKNFRDYGESKKQAGFNTLSKRFDQPTYMTFKLEFGNGRDSWYNAAAGDGLNYDRMPHPLFGIKGNDNVLNRESYSAIDYLLDANEHTRALMLTEFINKFNTLQQDYQYYFQEINGVDELLKINPKKGQRIPSDKRLKVKMLEGIDLRVSHIMNLYRKIAWDDTYQRWVLPDMMRYFTLRIYISEFRTFHGPHQYDGMGVAKMQKKEQQRWENMGLIIPRDYRNSITTPIEGELFLELLDDVFPSWVINCEMCEFDLENTSMNYLNQLSVSSDPAEAEVEISIKVGKIYEEQVYPIFKNMYLIDKLLNGFDRSKNEEPDTAKQEKYAAAGIGQYSQYATKEFNSTENDVNSNSKYGSNFKISQTTYDQDAVHQTGKPFNQQVDLPKFDLEDQNINPTQPNTWVGNAINFGKSFTKNLVNEVVDKAKMTPVPGLGFSFSEVTSAIQSKDIITALGLIRKSVNRVTETDKGYPSDHLGDKITDDAFRAFLVGVTQSAATSPMQVSLQEAANTALNDNGIWQKIKDYSKSTNLVGPNEINIQQNIQGKDQYRQITEVESQKQPMAMQRMVIEGIPTSAATNGQIIKG